MTEKPITYCNNAQHPHATFSEAMACDLAAHRKHVEELQQENGKK